MSVVIPRTKGGIVAENAVEKFERKTLADERKHERNVEQQKIAQQMEHLMGKVSFVFRLETFDTNDFPGYTRFVSD